ncbi:MAG: Helix-turn-helix domain protein [Verrucomicrobia bacterium ADurb.Bin118]|nr:MAG: Helix-turn-helix domain protein [Verrucomicrobia bacterium ADurb.Bin118]
MQEQERWLSVGEIAAHLGINRDTVYKWIDRKRMPAHKVGRLWKFKASQIDQWVEAGGSAQNCQGLVTTAAPRDETLRTHRDHVTEARG